MVASIDDVIASIVAVVTFFAQNGCAEFESFSIINKKPSFLFSAVFFSIDAKSYCLVFGNYGNFLQIQEVPHTLAARACHSQPAIFLETLT